MWTFTYVLIVKAFEYELVKISNLDKKKHL